MNTYNFLDRKQEHLDLMPGKKSQVSRSGFKVQYLPVSKCTQFLVKPTVVGNLSTGKTA
jgi:hypothetical protein